MAIGIASGVSTTYVMAHEHRDARDPPASVRGKVVLLVYVRGIGLPGGTGPSDPGIARFDNFRLLTPECP